MSKLFYMPSSDEAKQSWVGNFSSKLPNHAALLGITPETVLSVQKDAAMFAFITSSVNSFKAGLSERVSYKNILIHGPEGTPVGPVPVFNNLTPPEAVTAGAFVRLRRLVRNIKSNVNYNESIGNDLGIIGAEREELINDMKPVLKIKMFTGKPKITWKKGAADSIDIYVDRSDGKSFVYLANYSIPGFIDNSTLPENAVTAEWRYKAIYRVKDDQVGHFSDIVSAAVKKEIS